MKRLFFCLTGTLATNSRALRQTLSLSKHFDITAPSFDPQTPPNAPPNLSALHVPKPNTSGPGFFYALHNNFTWALEGIQPPAVLHASDLYNLPAVASAARSLNRPYTYDARELYANVEAVDRNPLKKAVWTSIERRFIRGAAHVFTVSPSIAEILKKRYKIRRPTVIPNTPVPTTYTKSSYLHDWSGANPKEPIILHQGQMRAGRGCEQLIRAISHLPDGQVVFLGNGPLQPTLQALASEKNLGRRVHFHPAVPPEDLIQITASANIGVTLLQDSCLNHRYALPNKLFEYIMANIPVLGSNLPEIRRVITEHNVGLTANQADPQELAQTLHVMLSDKHKRIEWAKNAKKAAETLNWTTSSETFLHIFLDIAGK